VGLWLALFIRDGRLAVIRRDATHEPAGACHADRREEVVSTHCLDRSRSCCFGHDHTKQRSANVAVLKHSPRLIEPYPVFIIIVCKIIPILNKVPAYTAVIASKQQVDHELFQHIKRAAGVAFACRVAVASLWPIRHINVGAILQFQPRQVSEQARRVCEEMPSCDGRVRICRVPDNPALAPAKVCVDVLVQIQDTLVNEDRGQGALHGLGEACEHEHSTIFNGLLLVDVGEAHVTDGDLRAATGEAAGEGHGSP